MKTTLRSLFACAAAGALAVSLVGCGPDDDPDSVSTQMALADGLAPGWSMMDLAGADPAIYGDGALPQALPMAASYGGGDEGYAPTYDYAPDDGDSYYEPLDDSYYYDDDGYDDGYYDEPYDDAGSYDLDGDTSGYALLAVATALSGVLGNAPPDYGFGYDGVSPWAWQTGDRYSRYAEPVQGGYRYYYYEPDAYRPFFVSDPYYSYGYRDDQVVAVYDRGGRRIDARRARLQMQAAKAYYARAERLHRAAQHDRRGVPAPLWAGQRETIAHDRNDWLEKTAKRPGWQQWEARNAPKVQRQWAGEALVRRDAERSFANWQRADYRTPAPKFYTPQVRQEQVRKIADLRQGHAKELADDRRERTEKRRDVRQQAQRIAERTERAKPRPAQPTVHQQQVGQRAEQPRARAVAAREPARIERARTEPKRPPVAARPVRQAPQRVAPKPKVHAAAPAPRKAQKRAEPPRTVSRPTKQRQVVPAKPKHQAAPARVERDRQVRAASPTPRQKVARPAVSARPAREARVEPQPQRQKVQQQARPERPKAVVPQQSERASRQPQARPERRAAAPQPRQAQVEKRQQARQERQGARNEQREARKQGRDHS